jgi:hypothetical protein
MSKMLTYCLFRYYNYLSGKFCANILILINGQYYPLEQLQDFIISCYPHLAERFRESLPLPTNKIEINGDKIVKVALDPKRINALSFDWERLIAHISKQKFILHHFNQ